MAFSDVIARLAVSLSLDTAAFQTGSRKAQREVAGLKGTMTKAATAIGGALAGMVSWEAVKQLRDWTQAAVDSAGALGEQAKAIGVSAGELQEYRYAATQVGLSTAEMDKGLEQLTRRMGEAAIAGKGPVVEAFKLLGLTLDEIKGKSAGEVIPLIADGLAKIEDPAVRAAIAVDLFGRSGQKLATLLASGAEGVNDLRQAAHDLGIVLSESEIANADEVADKVAALRYVLEAQQNRKLLDNADALLQYEQAVADLKIGLISFVNYLEENPPEGVVKWWQDTLGIDAFRHWQTQLRADITALASALPGMFANMVEGIRGWLVGSLNAVWKNVTDKITIVKAAFFGLYDAVIGHSYIPDMVEGIAAEMARLDAVMVAPVTAATSKASQAFRAMAGEVRGLLDRLFPETAAQMQYAAEKALIERSMTGEAQYRALNALARERGDAMRDARRSSGIDVDMTADPIDQRYEEGFERFSRRIQGVIDKSAEARVRVAKSFADMAQDTLNSLGRLTNAIKGGGFFDILQAVIGFGLQLGSAGAFGSGVSAHLNKSVPGYAGGTNFHPGGLALVGERGPELVSMPRGSKVFSNDNSRGMMEPTVVQLVVGPGQFFEPVVTAISGNVSVQQISRAGRGAMRQQRQAI